MSSVALNQIVVYGSASMPEADAATTGGAIDLTKRVGFADLTGSVADTVDVVSSSSSDTAVKLQITGRDATGAIQTPTAITLTGTTVIANAFASQLFSRLIAGVITGGVIAGLANPGGTAAVGDIAVMKHTRTIAGHTARVGSLNAVLATAPRFRMQAGDGSVLGDLPLGGYGLIIRITGGTGAGQLRMISDPYVRTTYGSDIVAINRDWTTLPDATSTYDVAPGFLFDIAPNPVTAITRMFATATADVAGGSSRTFYEKVFFLNVNTATALTSAQIKVASEFPLLPGSALLDLALCKVLNDTATTANRQTLPKNGDTTALTFVAQPAYVSVIASPGSLPFGNSAANAQGVWLRLTLPAATPIYNGVSGLTTTGSTV